MTASPPPLVRLLQAVPGAHDQLAPPVLADLERRVRALLAPRAADLGAARSARDRARADLRQLGQQLAATARVLDTAGDDLTLLGRPFSADMTIDQAWRRHPGVAAVFARHHLPACDGCSVRFDETVEEACAAYGLDLPGLLSELSALLGPTAD
ncbi:MAG: hypothetical protein H6742_13020 [Alphaproteobacteria bacterium]|nr:hypothetical protein [Alphaproteobacteria bacterium]